VKVEEDVVKMVLAAKAAEEDATANALKDV
jgi:hypothetical protein